MICPKCNKETEKGKFCTNCGANLEEFIEKEEKIADDKILKVKYKIVLVLFIIFILLVAFIAGTNIYFYNKNFKQFEEKTETVGETLEIKDDQILEQEEEKFQLTEENKQEDYDQDGLTNEKEVELGTDPINEDTDNDGILDGDEVNQYQTDPLKWSTSDDQISDYAKIVKELDIHKKYGENEVTPEPVEVNSSVTLVPKDLESETKGVFKEFSRDNVIKSYKPIFSVYNFEGELQYELSDTDVVLLTVSNGEYTEFKNYTIENDIMTIQIDKDSNSTDFVIVTKENYEDYQKGGND